MVRNSLRSRGPVEEGRPLGPGSRPSGWNLAAVLCQLRARRGQGLVFGVSTLRALTFASGVHLLHFSVRGGLLHTNTQICLHLGPYLALGLEFEIGSDILISRLGMDLYHAIVNVLRLSLVLPEILSEAHVEGGGYHGSSDIDLYLAETRAGRETGVREDEPLSDHDLVGNRWLQGLLARRRAGGAPSRAPGGEALCPLRYRQGPGVPRGNPLRRCSCCADTQLTPSAF